jgi:hypothetical protein
MTKPLGLLLAALWLTSCGMVGGLLNHQSPDPSEAQLKFNKGKGGAGPSANIELPGANAQNTAGFARQTASAGGNGAAPAGSLFDFSSAFQNQYENKLAHWRRSAMDAIAEARRSGMPLLIYMTESAQRTNPTTLMENSVSATQELTGDSPRFIPLRIDFSDKRVAESDYYKALRDRYKPRGYPVLIVTLPDGTELTRQSGCTEDWAKNVNHWLDDAASRARSGIELHRRKLTAQNYRLWKNSDGHEVFARLDKVDANQLTFTTEWGETIKTFTNRLSDSDREYIESRRQG